MLFSVNELKECLRRLRGLHAYGGDIFFTGIARTMVARPVVPSTYMFGQNDLEHQVEHPLVQETDKAMKAFVRSETKKLKDMTKVQHSMPGGGGIVRESPSPSKAQRAAIKVSETNGAFAFNRGEQ